MSGSRQLGDIAGLVSGFLEGGDPSLKITGIADLGNAVPGQVSFLGNSRYTKAAKETKASAVLVAADFKESLSCAVIKVANPSAAFAQVAALFTPPLPVWVPGIHPSAVVAEGVVPGKGVHIGPCAVIEPGVVLGDGVHIGAGAYVGHDSRIGEDSFLYPNVTLRERTVIGKRVIIHSGAVLGSDGFGYEFQNGRHVKVPQMGYVQLDDDVEIGSCTTIDRGRFDRTWIKEGCKIDNLVMIAHNVVIGPHAVIVAQNGISGSSTLGAYVVMGGQSCMVGHVHVADQVSITGWTAVTKDITKPGVYRGGPAKPIKESMKIEALTMRLPELYERLQKAEQELAALKQAKS